MITNHPGHDFDHIMRVYNTAEKLAKKEKANKKLVLYAALLHDIIQFPKSDKRSKQSSIKSSIKAKKFLQKFNLTDIEIKIITDAFVIIAFHKIEYLLL